jgi:lipopolysaccharide biosynthesis protein
LILKIHTKRSNHLKKKNLWKDDLFEKMIGKDCIGKVIHTFNQHQEIGMIGPSGHILPMSLYYGANAQSVLSLSLRMGLNKEQLRNLHFTAGTMFYIRKEALLPVLALGLKDDHFETEDKQLDGTMAHALERAITSSLLASGLKLADTSSTPENISCRIDKNYKFTL